MILSWEKSARRLKGDVTNKKKCEKLKLHKIENKGKCN